MSEDLTMLLQQWRSDDPGAGEAAVRALYPMLRALARKQLARSHDLSLQPTELAHEAWLKLDQQKQVHWRNREHFLAIAARLVRRSLIDHVRERGAAKRGGDRVRLTLDALSESEQPVADDDRYWLNLDRVLEELETFDPGAARLVEMRYFVGLSVPAVARTLGVSESTIARQWRTTRAWLEQRLEAFEV